MDMPRLNDKRTKADFALGLIFRKYMSRVFEVAVSPIIRRILANTGESRTLAALRDAQMPKLLLGAIRVKAAEKAG